MEVSIPPALHPAWPLHSEPSWDAAAHRLPFSREHREKILLIRCRGGVPSALTHPRAGRLPRSLALSPLRRQPSWAEAEGAGPWRGEQHEGGGRGLVGFVPFLPVRLPQESFVAFRPTLQLVGKGNRGFYKGQEFWGRVALRLPRALLRCCCCSSPPVHSYASYPLAPLPLW